MNKEKFCEVLEKLDDSMKEIKKAEFLMSDKMYEICTMPFDTCVNLLNDVLGLVSQKYGTVIDHFVYECDFGRDHDYTKIWMEEEEIADIRTAVDLWEYIQKYEVSDEN